MFVRFTIIFSVLNFFSGTNLFSQSSMVSYRVECDKCDVHQVKLIVKDSKGGYNLLENGANYFDIREGSIISFEVEGYGLLQITDKGIIDQDSDGRVIGSESKVSAFDYYSLWLPKIFNEYSKSEVVLYRSQKHNYAGKIYENSNFEFHVKELYQIDDDRYIYRTYLKNKSTQKYGLYTFEIKLFDFNRYTDLNEVGVHLYKHVGWDNDGEYEDSFDVVCSEKVINGDNDHDSGRFISIPKNDKLSISYYSMLFLFSDNDYRRCKYQGNNTVCQDLIRSNLIHINDTKLEKGYRSISFNGNIPNDLKRFIESKGIYIINRAAQPLNKFNKVVVDYKNGMIKLTYFYDGFISDFKDIYQISFSESTKSFKSLEVISCGSLIQAFSHIDIAKNAMAEWSESSIYKKIDGMYDSKNMAVFFLNYEY